MSTEKETPFSNPGLTRTEEQKEAVRGSKNGNAKVSQNYFPLTPTVRQEGTQISEVFIANAGSNNGGNGPVLRYADGTIVPDDKLPEGVKNGAGNMKRWIPREWKPVYDRIVAFHVLGKKPVWIADHLGMDQHHVMEIINSPQGVELTKKLQSKIQEKTEEAVGDRLSQIADLSARRIHQVLKDDDLFERSPFAVMDRAMAMLRDLGHIGKRPEAGNGIGAGGSNTTIINNNVAVISSAMSDKLAAGLERLQRVREIHGVSVSQSSPQIQSSNQHSIQGRSTDPTKMTGAEIFEELKNGTDG